MPKSKARQTKPTHFPIQLDVAVCETPSTERHPGPQPAEFYARWTRPADVSRPFGWWKGMNLCEACARVIVSAGSLDLPVEMWPLPTRVARLGVTCCPATVDQPEMFPDA